MALEVKKGDTWPPVRLFLKETNEAEELVPITNLGEAHEIRFIMKNNATRVEGVCTITNEGTGEVHYVWAEGDTSVIDEYEVEVQIEWESGGKWQTVPNSDEWPAIKIVENLAKEH